MRNLHLLVETTCTQFSESDPANKERKINWLGTGITGGTVIYGNNQEIFVLKDGDPHPELFRLPPAYGNIVAAEWLVAENTTFFATTDGVLALCWGEEITIASQITAGISAVQWSPDQEFLVVTTEVGHDGAQLLMLTADWTVVATLLLDPKQYGEQEFVNVGWGKKETQFHGSEGKDAARIHAKSIVAASSGDDLLPRISWRGDGQFFAVGSVHWDSRVRVIRIYDRQAVLQSTSELVSGLEWCLAWKFSGSLIASSQVVDYKREIIFFEKNGLRHGQFLLPFAAEQSQLKELKWNSSSEILLAWISVTEKNGDIVDCIQLWTCSNSHWYLKQSLRYPRNAESRALVSCNWSQSESYRLYLVDSGGKIFILEWIWDVSSSSDKSSTVAVIDGSKVLLTSFAFGITPPPSCTHTLTLDTFVNGVVFCSSTDFYELAVLTDHKAILIFSSNSASPTQPPVLRKVCDIPFLFYPGLFWSGMDVLAVVEMACLSNAPVWGLWQFSVKNESDKTLEALTSMEFLETDKTCKLLSYFDSPVVTVSSGRALPLVILKNGHVLQIMSRPEGGSDVKPFFKLPVSCDKVIVDQQTGSVVFYALNSSSRKLYRNSSLVSDACTSFAVSSGFLLYTTHHHKLVSVALVPDSSSNASRSLTDERQVERGARLVTTVTGKTEVVLQLPRGNLEVIHPRSLVVAKICRHLSVKEYAAAFELMRQHRIDMNLIVDFNVGTFLEDIPAFVKQINDSSNLNIFIAGLNDENVTSTVYKNHFIQPSESIRDKSNLILNRMQTVLAKIPGDHLFLSRLACHVYKKPQELEQALFKVKTLQSAGDASNAEEALRFVLYSANVDELFNITLGTYDLDLVIMVASKSGKDPKEYIPFLNQFRALTPSAYQKFAIDKHLKRYGKALFHLAQLGQEKLTECFELVVAHHLYKEALALFVLDGPERQRILWLYGEYLTSKGKFMEAAIAYEEGGHYDAAVDNYRKSLQWQLALSCAKKAGWDEKKISKTAELLALSLKSAHRYAEAAMVLVEYANNVSDGFGTLLTGHCWEHAHLLLLTRDLGADAQQTFVTALEEAHAAVQSQIISIRENLTKYTTRLPIVRQIKLERLERGDEDDPLDNMSETSSVSQRSSARSSRSGKSSKSRRKDEKAKHSLREGGRYEDLALLDALKSLYRQVDAMVKDVGNLLKFLLCYKLIDLGKELQQAFGSLITELVLKKPEIWTAAHFSFAASVRSGYVFGPNATANMIASEASSPAGNATVGDLSLSDLSMFVPPELNVASWNDNRMDQLAL